MSQSFDDIVLTTPVSFGYERYSEHDATWFAAGTLRQMLADSGLKKHDVDGLAIASFSLAPDTPPSLVESLGLELCWLEQLCFGGASGVIAAKRAARAIQAGDAEIIACIGADTLARGDFANLVANFSNATQDASYPYGAAGPNLAFALMTSAYMQAYDLEREDFAPICVSQRHNANANPMALFHDKSLTTEDYVNAKAVVEPLHLYDCVMPCAGAEGFFVMTADRAKQLGLPSCRLLAAEERFNVLADDPVQLRGGWSLFADALYNTAGRGPADIDVMQTYDDYPVIVMQQLEGFGFCAQGEAKTFVADTDLRFDGDGLPHNTGGGQLSGGQAGAAGGLLGIVEGIRQVCGLAGERQVTSASNALIGGYGMVNYDRCVCSSGAILHR